MDIYYILKTICDNLSKEFPNHDIYINNITQGFKRPSFYVSLVTFDTEDLVQGELDKNTTFEIVYFAPIDDRGQCDKLAQHVAHIKLVDMFSTQALTVNHDNPLEKDSRKDDFTRVKITSVSGGPRDNEVYMTMDFNYSYLPDTKVKPEDMYEIMQDLYVQYINIKI